MFASQSLSEHVVRGLGGFGLLALAVWLTPTYIGALLFVPLGLVLLRGCPMCWTMGLIETVWNAQRRRTGQPTVDLCATCGIDQAGAEHYGPR